jgi:hypothetical protein
MTFPLISAVEIAMLTPDVVRPYRIAEQSSEMIVLTSQPQWFNGILVSVCSLGLGVLLSWHNLSFLSLIAVVPTILFRMFYSFIPAALIVEPNHFQIRYRGFLTRHRSESFCAADISAFDGTPYLFRGYYAAVKLIRSNGTIKTIFSGPRGSMDLARTHSSMLAGEFSRIVGCSPTGSSQTA